MSGAPTGVPDLRASSRAGCRLSLPASSSWFPERWQLLSSSSVSPMAAGSKPSASRRRLRTAKLSSRCKVLGFFAPGDHGRGRDDGGGGGCVLCPLTLPASTQPCHRKCLRGNRAAYRPGLGLRGRAPGTDSQRPLLANAPYFHFVHD